MIPTGLIDSEKTTIVDKVKSELNIKSESVILSVNTIETIGVQASNKLTTKSLNDKFSYTRILCPPVKMSIKCGGQLTKNHTPTQGF